MRWASSVRDGAAASLLHTVVCGLCPSVSTAHFQSIDNMKLLTRVLSKLFFAAGMCSMIILGLTRGWASAYHLFPFTVLMMLGIPLFMSQSVAEVSTSCDDLCSSINGRRIEDLNQGPRMQQLELALGNLHNGQGLGFSTADTVIDKKKLRTMYANHQPTASHV